MNTVHRLVVILLTIGLCSAHTAGAASPDRYDVTWHSPSADASGSMPLGNGDIGLNAWIEPSGELVFYISKTDSWGDNARLLKVGRVRVRFDPPLPVTEFRQTLRLREGTMEAVYGEGDDATTIRLWVDANHPVIHVTADGAKPRTVTASIELWRTEPFELPSIEVSDVNLDRSKPDKKHAPTIVEPDTVLRESDRSRRLVSPQRQVGRPGPAREDARHDRLPAARPAVAPDVRCRDLGRRWAASGRHAPAVAAVDDAPSECLRAHEASVESAAVACSDGARRWRPSRNRASKIAARRTSGGGPTFWNRSWIDVTARDDAGGFRHPQERSFREGRRRRAGRQPRLCVATVHRRLRGPRAISDQVQRLDLHGAVRRPAWRRRLSSLGPRLLVAEHASALPEHVRGRRLRDDRTAAADVRRRASAAGSLSHAPLLRPRRGVLSRVHPVLGRRVQRDLRLDALRTARGQAPGQRLAQMGMGLRAGTRLHDVRLLRLHARRSVAQEPTASHRPRGAHLLRRALFDRRRAASW